MRDAASIEYLLFNLEPERLWPGNSGVPALSYEQGVEAALLWVLEETDEDPLEDP